MLSSGQATWRPGVLHNRLSLELRRVSWPPFERKKETFFFIFIFFKSQCDLHFHLPACHFFFFFLTASSSPKPPDRSRRTRFLTGASPFLPPSLFICVTLRSWLSFSSFWRVHADFQKPKGVRGDRAGRAINNQMLSEER